MQWVLILLETKLRYNIQYTRVWDQLAVVYIYIFFSHSTNNNGGESDLKEKKKKEEKGPNINSEFKDFFSQPHLLNAFLIITNKSILLDSRKILDES